MTTISVPLPKDLLDFVDKQIKNGVVENRSQAVRRALREMRQSSEFKDVLEALGDVKHGRVYEGDLDEIIRRKNV